MTIDLQRVLTEYPPQVAMAQWTPLGPAGGFSGGRVWRGRTPVGGELCLKAHAPGADADRLELVVHRWMVAARMAGLRFVPLVEQTRHRGMVVMEGGVWDICEWMPGVADFHANPTDARLFAAVEAIAHLHKAWSGLALSEPVPCPAVMRRWRALVAWEELISSGWRPQPELDDPVRPFAKDAWNRLPVILPRLWSALAPWLTVPVPVQPCFCDVWHDHILFTGDRVTGLIDFGAAKVDHVAVDLARLLGSLIPGDTDRMAAAMRAYQTIHPLPRPDLVELLDWTGTVIGVMNWLRWLYHDGGTYPDRTAVAKRFAELVRRLLV